MAADNAQSSFRRGVMSLVILALLKKEDMTMNTSIYEQTKAAISELCECAKLKAGNIVVVGCSTSEVLGSKWGTNSNPDMGGILFDAVTSVFKERGIYIAAQCCEHLNRAIVIEIEAVDKNSIVNVVPQPKAGGSFATAAYKAMKNPAVVEEIAADAGMDIGATLIGMHLKKVAVPVKLACGKIGEATVTAARTRAKFIGGIRAQYDEDMM